MSETTEKKRPLLTVERKILELFALVTDGIAGATEALLSGDKNQVNELVSREKMIDELYTDVEQLILNRISTLDLPSKRLHELITMLRMLPEIERSGDLAEHIAWRASRKIGLELSPRARGIIQRMCEILYKMWSSLSKAFEFYDADISQQLDELDDELDELHVGLTAEIVSANLSIPIAIEVAMVARFYERLGDHCVNLARRVTYLATS